MDRVLITETEKDRHGTIVAVRGYELEGRRRRRAFGPVSKGTAIKLASRYNYFVQAPDAALIPVDIVHGQSGDYLRSRADYTWTDNLAELPDLELARA